MPESFRPLASSVLRERASEWFELGVDRESPYKHLVAPVAASKLRAPDEAAAARTGLDRLNTIRSAVPAITHVDGTACVQTVDAARAPRYDRLLRAFEDRTGCPLLATTSLRQRGEPMVCTPAEALRVFLATGMDALVLEDLVLEKEDQPPSLLPPRAAGPEDCEVEG